MNRRPSPPSPPRTSLPLVILLATLLGFGLLADAQNERKGNGGKAPELPAWNVEMQKNWWLQHTTPEAWTAQAEELRATLVTMQRLRGTKWAMRSTDFRRWLGHTWWLSLFPADEKEHPAFARPEIRQAYATLAVDPELPWRFLAALRAEDDATAALAILCELAASDLAAVRAYPNLAIATAVVWDQPLPEAWPHSFVERRNVPIGRESIVDRFRFWIRAQHAGLLVSDLRRLSVNDLCFVVDNPLEFPELQYGQRFKLKNPDQLWDLYNAVEYDYDRVKKQVEPTWNRGAYRLHSIWDNGGICADQAYLASSVFQAKGVPSILFLGQGSSGGHAWVGYRKTDGNWVLDVARYRNQHYPVGQAYHPQTRQRISDAELESFARNLDRSGDWDRTRIFLGWARMNEKQPFYGELVTGARKLLPDLPETWELEERWCLDNKIEPRQLAAFYERWIQHFDKQPAMRFRGQKGLYKLYQQAGARREAEALKKQMLEETRVKRFDLGIHLASEEIFALIERRQWPEARAEFEQTMSTFRQNAGGHLFYSLLQPYVTACLEDRQLRFASDAMKHARRFDMSRTTILSNDIRSLDARVKAAR